MNAKTNEMSRGTRKALEAEIKRWKHVERILLLNPETDLTMPRSKSVLCRRFNNGCMRTPFWGDTEVCPVVLRTNQLLCDNSPYQFAPNSSEDCEREIDFLGSLWPEEYGDSQ